MDEIEIKPCPVCGKEGVVHKYHDGLYEVSCFRYSCDYLYTALAFDKRRAIELWNRMCDRDKHVTNKGDVRS